MQRGSIVTKIPGKKDFQLRKPIFLNDFSSWCVVTRFPGCSNGNSFSVLLKQLSIFLLFAHFFFWMMLSKPFNWNRMNTIENLTMAFMQRIIWIKFRYFQVKNVLSVQVHFSYLIHTLRQRNAVFCICTWPQFAKIQIIPLKHQSKCKDKRKLIG